MTPAPTPRNAACTVHLESVTTTGSGTNRPGLTINVYRVDTETGDRTPVRQYETTPAEVRENSHAFPPCTCPRCR